MEHHRLRLWLIAGLACVLPLPAAAQISTTASASILFFPKVFADGDSDTTIQITNRSRNTRHAHCFYIDGTLTHPDAPTGPENPPVWSSIDFGIFLTPLQPTHWVASRGRLADPGDARCTIDQRDCDGAGLDPGNVPQLPGSFHGELLCIEEDASGFPVPGNALSGKATLTNLGTNDVATYNAIGLRGFDNNNLDGTLCLGGDPGSNCPVGAEYEGCPQSWILDHPTEGSSDPIAGEESSVTTNITLVPCRLNLVTQVPEPVTVQFLIVNAFEERFSASTSVTCWADLALSDIDLVFESGNVGTDYAQTRITTVPASGPTASGIVVVAQTFREVGGSVTSSAANLHFEGIRSDTDRIVIPVQ